MNSADADSSETFREVEFPALGASLRSANWLLETSFSSRLTIMLSNDILHRDTRTSGAATAKGSKQDGKRRQQTAAVQLSSMRFAMHLLGRRNLFAKPKRTATSQGHFHNRANCTNANHSTTLCDKRKR